MNTYKSISLGFLLAMMIAASSSAQISKPSVVGPENNNRTSSTPTLHWEKLSNATWYRVWISNISQGTTHLKRWIKGSNSWTIPDKDSLNPDDTYRWWVAGWNSSDDLGPWSDPAGFQAGKVHYTTVNANEFIEKGTSRDSGLSHLSGRIVHLGTDPFATAFASVHLPDDAIITKVTSHWEDFDPDGDLKVLLVEHDNSADGVVFADSDLASQGNGGEGSSSATGLSKKVDTSNHYYQVQVRFPDTGNDKVIQLQTVRIKYIR